MGLPTQEGFLEEEAGCNWAGAERQPGNGWVAGLWSPGLVTLTSILSKGTWIKAAAERRAGRMD